MSTFQKPLKRIVIEEIGSDSSSEDEYPVHPTESVQTQGHVTSATPTSQSRGACLPVTSTHGGGQQKAALSKTFNVHHDVRSVLSSQSTFPTQASVQPSPNRAFSVPKTSVQFLADWRVLQDKPAQQYQYLKVSVNMLFINLKIRLV